MSFLNGTPPFRNCFAATEIKKTNSKAATVITRIPPSAQYMFGGDHSQLAKVVELMKDFSTTDDRSSFTTPKGKSKFRSGQGGGAGIGRGGPGGCGRDHGEHNEGTNSGAGGNKRRRSEAECMDLLIFISYTIFNLPKLLSAEDIHVNPYRSLRAGSGLRSRSVTVPSLGRPPGAELDVRRMDPVLRHDHNGSVLRSSAGFTI